MNKKQTLIYLETMMHKAIAAGNLVYGSSTAQESINYNGCLMTINTSFDCLDRTYRRVVRPSSNAKLMCGKRLLNRVDKFLE